MLVRRMKGDVEYQKDKLGAVAMHNLIIQKEEIKRIQSAIQSPGDDALIRISNSRSDERNRCNSTHIAL